MIIISTLAGADTVDKSVIHPGATVDLIHRAGLTEDIGHNWFDADIAINHGTMDGFDPIGGAYQHGVLANYSFYREAHIPAIAFTRIKRFIGSHGIRHQLGLAHARVPEAGAVSPPAGAGSIARSAATNR